MNKITVELTVDQLNQLINALDQTTKTLINNLVQQAQPQIAQQQAEVTSE